MSRGSNERIPIGEEISVDATFDGQLDPALILDSLDELPRSCTLLGAGDGIRDAENQSHETDYLYFSVGNNRSTKFFCSPCVLHNSRILGKVHLLNHEDGLKERIYGKTYIEVDLQEKIGRWLVDRVKEYAHRQNINMCWSAYKHQIVYLIQGRAHVEARLPSQAYGGPQIRVRYAGYDLTLLQMMAMTNEDVAGMGVFTCRLVEYRSWHEELREMALCITLTGFQHVPGGEEWLLPSSRTGSDVTRYVASGYLRNASFVQLVRHSTPRTNTWSSLEQESEEEKEQEPRRSNKRMRLSDHFHP